MLKYEGVFRHHQVQCDDCDRWYHTECAGANYDVIKSDVAEFHCGCLWVVARHGHGSSSLVCICVCHDVNRLSHVFRRTSPSMLRVVMAVFNVPMRVCDDVIVWIHSCAFIVVVWIMPLTQNGCFTISHLCVQLQMEMLSQYLLISCAWYLYILLAPISFGFCFGIRFFHCLYICSVILWHPSILSFDSLNCQLRKLCALLNCARFRRQNTVFFTGYLWVLRANSASHGWISFKRSQLLYMNVTVRYTSKFMAGTCTACGIVLMRVKLI